jgi:hypothetical protein
MILESFILKYEKCKWDLKGELENNLSIQCVINRTDVLLKHILLTDSNLNAISIRYDSDNNYITLILQRKIIAELEFVEQNKISWWYDMLN